jgi:IS5 family transposase
MIAQLSNQPQADFFKTLLRGLVNPDHPLVRLAHSIDWDYFEDEFAEFYCHENGRPACPIRVMVGLQYLRAKEGISDDDVLAHWVENPYWQYFTGGTSFTHEPPTDQATMSRWRKRVGEKGAEALLLETLRTALRTKVIKPSDFERVNVDTTVQPKNIRFPTDARLYDRMRERLVKLARKHGLALERSYVRTSKTLLRKISGYAKAKQCRRVERATKKLKKYLAHVADCITAAPGSRGVAMEALLQRAQRLLAQKREDKNKLYSVHEPQVECIAKGKAHKPYEFGVKAGVVTTSKGNWVIGALAFAGNPYDGHTLAAALEQSERLCGRAHKMAVCDLSYRAHDYTGPCDIQVVQRNRRGRSRGLLRWWKRRSAVEPVIGHMKSDHGLGRNMLCGELGDKLNVIFAGIGFNLRKLLRAFARFLSLFLGWGSFPHCRLARWLRLFLFFTRVFHPTSARHRALQRGENQHGAFA